MWLWPFVHSLINDSDEAKSHVCNFSEKEDFEEGLEEVIVLVHSFSNFIRMTE